MTEIERLALQSSTKRMWNLSPLRLLPLGATASKVVCGCCVVWVVTRKALTSLSVIWGRCREWFCQSPSPKTALQQPATVLYLAWLFQRRHLFLCRRVIKCLVWVARRVAGSVLFLKPTTAHLHPHVYTSGIAGRLCTTSGPFCGRWNDCLLLFAFLFFFSQSKKLGRRGHTHSNRFRTCRPELKQVSTSWGWILKNGLYTALLVIWIIFQLPLATTAY